MKKIVSQLSAALFVGALVFTTSCKKEVVVSADKTSVAIGEIVRFQALEDDSKLKGSYISWDFGDGDIWTNNSAVAEIYNNNNRVAVEWAYGAAGTYTVTAVVNKSRRPTKKNAKSTFGKIDITVNSVTPAFEMQDATGSVITETRDGRVVSFVNKTDEGTVAQSSFNYGWVVNGGVVSSNKNYNWTATPGTYKVKLRLMQGNTTTYSAEQTLVVDGLAMDEDEMQNLIGGQWNVTTLTGVGTGNEYTLTTGTTPCRAVALSPTPSSKVSKIYLDKNGNCTWSISSETLTSGNLNNGGMSIDVVNSTTVDVSGLSWNGVGSINGLYTTTVNGTSMTLKRTDKGGSTNCPYTDEFTIVLSR